MRRWTWSLLLLAGCVSAPQLSTTESGPARLGLGASAETLRLSGDLRGAFPGIGPKVELMAWVRADGRARVDLRSTGEGGHPTHEVLLWGPESCFLFNAVTGRFAELGEAAGKLDGLGNHFELRDAVFLACGLDPAWPGIEPTELLGSGVRFRGVRESGTLRRDGSEAGLRWQGDDDAVHYITVTYQDYFETSWGPWPSRLEISGTDLAAAARLQWEALGPIVVLGDSIFDPLWEPAAR